MEICAECGAGTALIQNHVVNYEYKVLDCPVVLVNAVVQMKCPTCDRSIEVIPNHEGLIAAVAICRVMMPFKLNGKEIRLLRNALGLKGVEFAKKLSVASETVSRWESGKEPIGNAAEKYLRVIAALELQQKATALDIDINKLTSLEIVPFRPSKWPELRLELVKVKRDNHKDTAWDTAEAA